MLFSLVLIASTANTIRTSVPHVTELSEKVIKGQTGLHILVYFVLVNLHNLAIHMVWRHRFK